METDAPSVSTADSSASARNSSGIRRHRASYSCQRCRDRRVKCDQVHPTCGSCSKSDTHCHYPDNTQKRKRPDAEREETESTRKSRIRTEAAVRPRIGYLSLQTGGRSRYLESTFWACVDEENLELDSLISELPLFPLDSFCCAANQEGSRNHSTTCRHYVGSVDPNFSFWVSGDSNVEMSCRDLAKVLEELPSRESCDEMYYMFRGGVHPLIPLIHLPSFEQHYRSFWNWYLVWDGNEVPDGVLAETPSFLPLLVAVLFAGAFASYLTNPYRPGSPQSSETTQSKLYRLTLNSLALVGFPQNPALYSLVAFLITQNLLIREEESLSSCSFVSVAFRIAQAMGIHRDGAHFGLDPVQTEMRRRIWWHLSHVDVMTAIISGLPPIILDTGYYDTKMVGEFKDEHIGKARKGPNKHDDNFWLWSPYVLTVGRYDATSCIRSILRRQFSLQPMTAADVTSLREMIEKLNVRLEERIKKLQSLHFADALQYDPLHRSDSDMSPTYSLDAFNAWIESLLRLMVEKAYCLLYQPLIRDASLWAEIRPEAIPKFQSFLRIYIHMCNTKPYRPFKWLYPGSYQPLQPTAVLLMDLMKNPNSPESRVSRTLLEKIFSLLGPEGRVTTGQSLNGNGVSQRHLSGGAKDAWGLLDKLRKRVWRKIGLDSSVRWSRTLGQPSDASESGWHDTASTTSNQDLQASERDGSIVSQRGPNFEHREPDYNLANMYQNANSPVASTAGSMPEVSEMGYLNLQEALEGLQAPFPSQSEWMGWDSMHGGFF